MKKNQYFMKEIKNLFLSKNKIFVEKSGTRKVLEIYDYKNMIISSSA